MHAITLRDWRMPNNRYGRHVYIYRSMMGVSRTHCWESHSLHRILDTLDRHNTNNCARSIHDDARALLIQDNRRERESMVGRWSLFSPLLGVSVVCLSYVVYLYVRKMNSFSCPSFLWDADINGDVL